MKSVFKKFAFLLFVNFALLSCKKEAETSPAIFTIDKELRPYFNAFLKEAKLRNKIIDTTNLILKFNNNLTTSKCGTCTQYLGKPARQKSIEIFKSTDSCWLTATTNGREALVFHELGHCLLGRIEHKNTTFSDGSPQSIMIASNTDLYTPCVYVLDDDPTKCNKTARRQYYIDELFNVNTPQPSWVK
jgi:hypothetical protein